MQKINIQMLTGVQEIDHVLFNKHCSFLMTLMLWEEHASHILIISDLNASETFQPY